MAWRCWPSPGRLTRRYAGAAALAFAFALTLPATDPARAQDHATEMALAATSKTQLAYVVTGNSEIDATSKAGMEGLSRYLADRTALEPGDPAAVDIANDELAFYALLYWPIDPDQPTPSAETMAKVDTFMKNGGTVLFDTRDAGGFTPAAGGDTPETLKLRDILSLRRRATARAGAARSRADQGILSAVGISRPLGELRALGREPLRHAAGPHPPGARRRRGLADHHHRQRSRRRLGDRRRRRSGSTRPSPPIRASASSPSAPASTS